MYKQNLIINIITSIFGILLGLLLCFSEAEDFLRFVFGAISIYLLFLSIPNLIFINRFTDKNERIQNMVISIIMIVMACLLIFYPTTVATFIVGTVLVVIPIYKLIVASNKKETLKKEIIKLVLGVVLLLFGVSTFVKIILYILGGLVIALSLIYLVYGIYIYIKLSRHTKRQEEENEVIDL